MSKKLSKRKAQRPFVNKEICFEQIQKDYEKFKIRLEKKRDLS